MSDNVYADAAWRLLRESGCQVVKTRTSLTGCAWTDSDGWDIEVPDPRGPKSFAVFAHEVAHQLLHRDGGRSRPAWQKEIEAWEWALAQFDRFGLPGEPFAFVFASRSLSYAFYKSLRRSPDRQRLALRIAEHTTWWASLGWAKRAAAARERTVTSGT